jgi:hypothetical protein
MQRAAAGLRRETGDAERARDDARAAAREQARPPAPIVDSDNNNNYNNNGSARRRPNLTSRGSLLLAQWLQWLTVPRAPRQAERSRAREAALRGEAEEQRAARGALLEVRAPPPPLDLFWARSRSILGWLEGPLSPPNAPGAFSNDGVGGRGRWGENRGRAPRPAGSALRSKVDGSRTLPCGAADPPAVARRDAAAEAGGARGGAPGRARGVAPLRPAAPPPRPPPPLVLSGHAASLTPY